MAITPLWIIDEDWSKADPIQLGAAGYSGAIGYVSEDTTGKNITRAQIDALHNAGLDVGLVYEYAPGAAGQGASRGNRDAGIAVSQARALGTPAGVCLYAAVDFQPTSAQLPAVWSYASAFAGACAAAGYRAGIYGSYQTCQYLDQHGWSGLLWQTYAWSSGLWWPSVAVRQVQNGIHVANATVDRDEALVIDWGQWRAEGMTNPLSAADERRIANADQYLYDLVNMQNPLTNIYAAGDGTPLPNLPNPFVQILQKLDDLDSKLGALGTPAPATVDTHALATELITELEAAGMLTADGAHQVVKAVLDAKLAAAQAA